MIRRITRSARLSDEAIALLVSPDGRAQIAAWRARSSAHEEAITQAESLLDDIGSSDAALVHRTARDAQPGRPNRRTLLVGGLAAAAVAAFAVDRTIMPATGWLADYATRVGERRRVVLDGGTVAWLNTASAFSMRAGGDGPVATVHAGEVLFRGAGRAARPFSAIAGEGVIRGDGGDFLLCLLDGRCDVTALRGMFDVTVGGRTTRLQAGQAIAFSGSVSGPATTVSPIAATAWLRGKLIFQRRTVAAIVADMQRYTPTRIVVLGDRLRAARLSGVFEIDDPDGLFRAIADATGARIDHVPGLTLLHGSE